MGFQPAQDGDKSLSRFLGVRLKKVTRLRRGYLINLTSVISSSSPGRLLATILALVKGLVQRLINELLYPTKSLEPRRRHCSTLVFSY